jgi:diguanylate cyclase (GGDEF)-like protein
LRFSSYTDLNAPFMLYAIPALLAAGIWGRRGGIAAGSAAAALTLLATLQESRLHPLPGVVDTLVLAGVLLAAPIGAGILLERERRARGFYAALVETVREGVLVVEPDLRISFTNQAARRNFSCLNFAACKYLPEVFPPEVVAACQEALAQARHGKSEPRQVEPHLVVDGGERVLRVCIHPQPCCGGTVNLTLMVSDITASWLRFKHLETLSCTDELTGLGNYRFLRERLAEEVALARRHGEPLALAIMDLDNFKSINDTYGHLAGNRVLREVAETLRRVTRESDIVARFGGDEFALIMPLTIRDEAEVAAQRIHHAIRRLTVKVSGGTVRVSTSIGLACFPEDAGDPEGLIEAADARLYHAKEAAATAEGKRARATAARQ